MTHFKIIQFPQHDVNDHRLVTLRKELDQNCELLPIILEMLIDFTKDFPIEDDGLIGNCEARLVEAQMWAEKWVDFDESEDEIKKPNSRES